MEKSMVTVLENLIGSFCSWQTTFKPGAVLAENNSQGVPPPPDFPSAFATLVQQLLKSFGWIFV